MDQDGATEVGSHHLRHPGLDPGSIVPQELRLVSQTGIRIKSGVTKF